MHTKRSIHTFNKKLCSIDSSVILKYLSKREQCLHRYLCPLSFGERQQSSFLRGCWQAARQRRSTAVAYNVQRSSWYEITLRLTFSSQPIVRRSARSALRRTSPYTFVNRLRRLLSRDLGAEMLFIMRPDKPALCRVLSITRRICHERNAQRNRYMPPRLSTSLRDAWSHLLSFSSWLHVFYVIST